MKYSFGSDADKDCFVWKAVPAVLVNRVMQSPGQSQSLHCVISSKMCRSKSYETTYFKPIDSSLLWSKAYFNVCAWITAEDSEAEMLREACLAQKEKWRGDSVVLGKKE